jgi:pilus assembly protein CpaE
MNMLGRTAPPPSADSPATQANELRVTVAVAAATAEQIDTSRLAIPGATIRVITTGLAGFINNGPLQRWTDVLVAEVDARDARSLEAFERFARDHADRLPVIGAVRDLTVPITRSMLHAQAVDVLPIPFSPDELLQSIAHGRDRLQALRPDAERRGGRVIAFIGALGGMGTTSIATQTAALWASSASVCLIDLDVQFGNAALYLNVRSQLSLADIVDVGDRLDVELLRSVAERHPTGLSVITCPPDILPLDALTPEFVDRLIAMAAEAYDVVILDIPGAWVSWSLSALQKSDLIVMLTTLSVPGVHQARRQLELLDANGLAERLRLVANRVANPLYGKLDLSEPEKLLRRRFATTIVNDWTTMSTAIEEGRTVSSVKMKSRLEKDLRALVTMLATVDTGVIVE